MTLELAGKLLNMYCTDVPILVIWPYKYQWVFLIVYAVLSMLCTYIISDSFALILGTIVAGIGLIVFPMLNFPKGIVDFGNLSFSFY